MKKHLSEILRNQKQAVYVLEKILGLSNSESEKTQQARLAVAKLKDVTKELEHLLEKDKIGSWLLLKSKEKIDQEFLLGGDLDSELMQEQVESFNAIYSEIDKYQKGFFEEYKKR